MVIFEDFLKFVQVQTVRNQKLRKRTKTGDKNDHRDKKLENSTSDSFKVKYSFTTDMSWLLNSNKRLTNRL